MAPATLRLGPLLGYADSHTATVWIEADRPREAEVVCDSGAHGAARTWQIADDLHTRAQEAAQQAGRALATR